MKTITLEQLNTILDRMVEGWQEVDAMQAGEIIVPARSFYVAVEALRQQLRNELD